MRHPQIVECDGKVFVEPCMDVCEVGDEFVSGMGGGKVIGIGGEFRVVTLVCEERSGSGGRTLCVVVCELGNRESVGQVILLIATMDAEVLLQRLIYAFGLTISLGVVA
jgi:hypothetical protein